MTTWLKITLPVAALAALLPGLAETKAPAAPSAQSAVAIGEITRAAQDFLGALDDAQKATASFPLDDPERQNWRFIPIERKGLPLKEMRPDQQHLAYGLLHSALSHQGFRKATQIMSLEKILFDLENSSPKRDAGRYFFSIFGTPTATGTWGWRFEGHHCSMNFTIIDGKHIALTPSFMGTNPGKVASGPREGLEVLEREDRLGFELINACDDEQKKVAIIATVAPDDVITKEEKRANPLTPTGIMADKLTAPQREKLQMLIEEYIRRYRAEIADETMAHIHSLGWDKIGFAWAGSTTPGPGNGHYYRVQGPDFLLEYDNTQNNAMHPHAVWRDFTNDFGLDLLKQHYDAAHAK